MAKVDFPSQVSATNPDWLLGANASAPAKTPILAPGRALLAAPTDVDQRSVLGLGTAATEDTQAIIDAAVAATSSGGTTYLAAFGDATPATVFTVPPTQALDSIDVEVIETWDGVGATVHIGVAGDPTRYFGSADLELTELASFTKAFTTLGTAPIVIIIFGGASPTRGKLRLQISTTAAGT